MSGPGVCEICELPGHDIFNCDLLKGGSNTTQAKSHWSNNDDNSLLDLFCEDCESHGHSAANCPHSMDIF
jgi:hypothetical protein